MCRLCNDPFHEETNATIIIGACRSPYEFWVDEPREEYQTKRGIPKRRLDKQWFENDTQAIEWLKENYPAEFKQGVEMRVFEVIDGTK